MRSTVAAAGLFIFILAGCGWWSQRPASGDKEAAQVARVDSPAEEVQPFDSPVTPSQAEDANTATELAASKPLRVEAEPPKASPAPTSSQPRPKPKIDREVEPKAPPVAEAPARHVEKLPEPVVDPGIPVQGSSTAAEPPSPATDFDQAAASLPPPPSRPGIVVPPGPPRAGSGAEPVTATPSETYRLNPQAPEPIRLAEGTVLEVRLSEQIGTRTHRAGDTFEAILDREVETVDGRVVPKGTAVEGTVVEALEPGRVKGRASLTFVLSRLWAGEGAIPIETNRITMEAESSKGDDLKKVGVGAAVGTALGAIFGGKKGAAVGAATGAGAGTAGVLLSRGNHVEIDKERLFSFRLEKEAVE